MTRNEARALGIIRSVNTILLVLFSALAAWLSTRYHATFDWTSAGRNTLSEASTKLLDALDAPLAVTVFAHEDRVHGRVIAELLRKYQNRGADIRVEYINPDLNPERLRALGIKQAGAVQLRYKLRTQLVDNPSERTISNTLAELLRSGERNIAFLVGHGERSLVGKANHDLGAFGVQLQAKGLSLHSLNLAQVGEVPTNTDVLVLAGPRVALLPVEVNAISRFIDGGGNLLWLLDPRTPWNGLETLAKGLGIHRLSGTLIDPATQRFGKAGLSNPTFVLVADYHQQHRSLRDFALISVLPGAAPLAVDPTDGWHAQALFRSNKDVWSELGTLGGQIGFDANSEQLGPHNLAYALTRRAGERQQRIVIVGDGDFLSNSALGNSGNLDLGMRLTNWLAADDVLLNIPTRADPDATLNLSKTQTAIIGFGSLLALPIVLISIGIVVWLRRRHR
jgi:ABC-type uncharacterized transport system involved in gliding motility auxiliary subunit